MMISWCVGGDYLMMCRWLLGDYFIMFRWLSVHVFVIIGGCLGYFPVTLLVIIWWCFGMCLTSSGVDSLLFPGLVQTVISYAIVDRCTCVGVYCWLHELFVNSLARAVCQSSWSRCLREGLARGTCAIKLFWCKLSRPLAGAACASTSCQPLAQANCANCMH